MMRKREARPTVIELIARRRMAYVAGLVVLAACSSNNVNEAASSTTYNASYAGPATLSGVATQGALVGSGGSPVPLTATVTMSQLSSTVTGTITVVTAPPSTTPPVAQDTVLQAGVMGHTTPSGLDVTIVQPSGCATHFSGPLTLQPDGKLAGALSGSDCNATGQNDLVLTVLLTRQ